MSQIREFEFAGFRCRSGARRDGLPTENQAKVIAGIAAGLTHKEIAKLRGVSPQTIKSTAEAVYFWLQATRGVDAAIKAMRRGWIVPLMVIMALSSLSPDVQMQRVRQPRNRTRIVSMTKMARREVSGASGGAA